MRWRRSRRCLPEPAAAGGSEYACRVERDSEDTIIRPPARADHGDVLWGDTVIRESAAPAVVPSAAVPELVAPAALPPMPVALAPAPASYSFQVNRHEPIGLEVPAIIGRRPSRPRLPSAPSPRLVRVPSPLQEVSSSHLELRQSGSSVIVTDLRSTNGTIVRMPGCAAQPLRPGESLVVAPGTIVDIGDGNRVEILPIQRAQPPAGSNPDSMYANGRHPL